MSISPNPTRADWKKQLPVSVIDWIEEDLHRSFEDVVRISLEAKPLTINHMATTGWSSFVGPALTHYTFFFLDGKHFETDVHPMSRLLPTTLIKGYNDIVDQFVWIDRYIMGEKRSVDDAPDYSINHIAYPIISHLLKRGDNDPLLRCFARKLVDDANITEEELVPVLMWDTIAAKYTASQICTAAYRAFNEIEREQANGV